MYKVCIYNNGMETIIHYPSSDKDIPHILDLPFTESLSQPEQLSFTIPYNNPGYNLIEGLKTKVKVFNIHDNSVVFSGRVITIGDGFDSDGSFSKKVTCEGAMSYLNDTQTRRWEFEDETPEAIITALLGHHNTKMDNSRKIYPGTIELTELITVYTNYETTLNTIIAKIRNILGGDLRVRETDGLLYLDYLIAQGRNSGVEIRIGYNLKDITREYDPTDVVTRVIPLGYGEGINQLGINKVNSNVEYLEDATAVAKYGVIEGTITNKDIQSARTLKLWGQTVLNEQKQPRLSYQQTVLDLSVLPDHENEKYELGDTIHTFVEMLNLDVYSRVIERDRDLINEPWNPTLTISTRPITLTDQIVDLKQRNQSLENAPQGNTYIDTFGYADNVDGAHPFSLPIWISPDILFVNRVRLYIEPQQYRAYEQGVSAAAGSTQTSDFPSEKTDMAVYSSDAIPINDSHYHSVDLYVGDHKHTVEIPEHTHDVVYAIFEEDYPSNMKVKIDGVTIAGPFDGTGTEEIDITGYIDSPGSTYQLEITSSGPGRVSVWVSIQAFIQTK
jgi:phage minor structural protein